MSVNYYPMQVARPAGYSKQSHIRHHHRSRVYFARISYGYPAVAKVLRKKFKTASEAVAYGSRFCVRYNRLLAMKAGHDVS